MLAEKKHAPATGNPCHLPAYWHTPIMHMPEPRPKQLHPQLPQLLESSRMLAHLVPQRRWPAPHMQMPPMHISPLPGKHWLAQKPQFIGSLVTSMHSPPHILPGAGQSPDGVGLVGAGLSDGGGEAGESAGEAGTSAGEAGGTEGLSGDGEGSEVGGGAVVLPLPAEVLRKPELQVIAGPCIMMYASRPCSGS